MGASDPVVPPPCRLSFVVPGPPRPKARARLGKGGKWYTPALTARYEATVRTYAFQAALRIPGWTPPFARRLSSDKVERFRIIIRIFFPDRRRRDLDNICKSIQDAANGILWKDDSQVTSVRIDSDVDAVSPRVEVDVVSESTPSR